MAKKQLDSPTKAFFLSKILITVSLYTFLIVNSLHNLVTPDHVPECIKDEMHELTLPINQFLEENRTYKNMLIIISSLMIDVTSFSMTMRFLFFERNYKLPLTILAFYLLRGFMQSVFYMRFPSDYIWSHPGIFSVTVPYAPANDFFFSGHVGVSTICYIYFKRQNSKLMKYFAAITIIIEFCTLLITRAHYFIDLITGMIVAHYIYLVGDWVQDYLIKRQNEKEKKAEAEETITNANQK